MVVCNAPTVRLDYFYDGETEESTIQLDVKDGSTAFSLALSIDAARELISELEDTIAQAES